jgi:signal peptidase I
MMADSKAGPIRKWGRRVFAGATLGFLVVVAILRYTTYDTVIVIGDSMKPTLYENDRLWANRRAYRSHGPERGDIVIVTPPDEMEIEIKRVVALPGDIVDLQRGRLLINSTPVEEPFTEEPMVAVSWEYPVIVPADAVFVMGDNRNFSKDSRDFGPVAMDRVRAKATRVFYPFSRWRRLVPPPELKRIPRRVKGASRG